MPLTCGDNKKRTDGQSTANTGSRVWPSANGKSEASHTVTWHKFHRTSSINPAAAACTVYKFI